MHSDIEVDISLSGHSNNLTLEGVLITIQPLGSSNECVVFLQLLEESVGRGLLGNSDDIASLDQVAGDVDAAAVDGEMTVVNQLTSLTAGVGEAQTVNNVVQTVNNVVQTALAEGEVFLRYSGKAVPQLLRQGCPRRRQHR